MPKPQTVICYICGREFGSYSINVHERQCAKRWESQRSKEKESEKREQKRKTSQLTKERFNDPWVKRDMPSIRLQSQVSKSMVDIRVSNGHTEATVSNKQLMHTVRPMTVTLGEREKINGDVSVEEINTFHNAKGGPKVSRPGTAVLAQRFSSSLLPSKMDANSIIKARNGETTKTEETLTKPLVSLRKYSAPEPTTCASPESSTSSQISSDSQDTSVGTPDVTPPRFRSTKNPNMLVCYICGNDFGSKSLKIHEPQCLKKWKLANPRYYSRKGSHGGMFKAESLNSFHGKGIGFTSKQSSENNSKKGKTLKSASCENLLDIGSSGTLRPTNSLQALKELSRSQGRLYQSTKPKMEPCYICGKDFIKHSLEVHEKQCKKKWDAIKIKNDKEEKAKKKHSNSSPSKRHSVNLPVTIQIEKVDDIQNNNLDQCQKENQDLQQNHEQRTVKVSSKERKSSMATCYLCGRSYGSASIFIHEKQCQKKWETETARKAKEQLRPKSGTRKTRPRPSSFVL